MQLWARSTKKLPGAVPKFKIPTVSIFPSVKNFYLSLTYLTPPNYSHGQNIWDKFQFSCEIVHYGKSSISFFKESSASIDNIFVLEGRLGTRL